MRIYPIGEVLSPKAVIPVRAQDEISHLNRILLFGDCAGERLTMKVALRYWSCKLAKIPSFGCNKPLRYVLTKKWQLR